MSLQQNEDTSGFQVEEDGLSTITASQSFNIIT